jgi:sulfate adenylyltransferase
MIEGDRISLSGTKVREMLLAGQRPPEEFTRAEVADILIAAMRKT